jgi:hypothetical protein
MPEKKDKKDKGEERAATPTKTAKYRAGMGGTQKRVMREDTIGEGGPGPGAYLPASTFGKAAASTDRKGKKALPTSAFRSKSQQRPVKKDTEKTPGPGTHTPDRSHIEPNRTNSAAQLKSQQKRFGSGGMDWSACDTPKAIGPGAYNSHYVKSITESVEKSIKATSQGKKGFGTGTERKLPFEEEIEEGYKPYVNVPEAKHKLEHTSGSS